jgi:rubrerythrin
MRYDVRQEKILCPDCNYAPLDARIEAVRTQGPRPAPRINYRGTINRNARVAFESGHDYLHKGDTARALESFKRAAYFQPDFIDAHIAIADLVEDEKTKRHHLSEVIAYDPSNLEALRRLMVLNGRLTEAEMARTYHHNDQRIEQIEQVEVRQTEVLLCPVCGGHLTVYDATGQVECKFCGHVEVRASSGKVGSDLLAMALIERKAKATRWIVGQRVLSCQECGAQRTIPARKLTHECPFCGSQHVIQQEPQEGLEQPDGLVHFQVSRQQATAAIRAELNRMRYRIANLFDKNRIAHGTIDGLYVPFWLFDAMIQGTVSRVAQAPTHEVLGISVVQEVRTETVFTDGIYDVPVCGSNALPSALTARLMPYDLSALQAYQPKLLAKYPAELYNIDFDKASLEARSMVSKAMRAKHSEREIGEEQVRISVSSTIQSMSFRLVLLPVWIATLIEEDNDVRTALVNGQTGAVALGRSQKRPN